MSAAARARERCAALRVAIVIAAVAGVIALQLAAAPEPCPHGVEELRIGNMLLSSRCRRATLEPRP